MFRKSYHSYLYKWANQLFSRRPQTFQNELCSISESCPHFASSWMETVCQAVMAGVLTTDMGTLLTSSLGVTTVLSMTTLMIGSRTSLPNTNCFIKAIDVYLGICFSFVFGALLEYAVAHYSSLQQMAAKDRVRIWGLCIYSSPVPYTGLSTSSWFLTPRDSLSTSDSHPCSIGGIWQSWHLFKKTILFANEILICLIF